VNDFWFDLGCHEGLDSRRIPGSYRRNLVESHPGVSVRASALGQPARTPL